MKIPTISIKERYRMLTKYVNDRRSQEHQAADCKDWLMVLVLHGRRTVTTLFNFYKENVTRRRMLLHQKLGLED